MAFIIVIAGIAGLLWGTLFVLRGWLPGGCLALIVAASCFGHAFLQFDLGAPLTHGRLVLVLLLVASIVQRGLGRAESKPMMAVDSLVLPLAVVFAASTFTPEWRVSGPKDISP